MAVLTSTALTSISSAQVSGSHPATKIPAKPVSVSVPSTTPPLAPLVGGSDNCSTAAATNPVVAGTYSVDTTLASSGAPIGNCGAIGNDVWFYYTASLTGAATVSTCGGTMDSVLAIWNDGSPAGSCPTTQILCLDDSCGVQTSVTFQISAGAKYFIEMGGYASQTYVGSFTVTEAAPPPPMPLDDCSLPGTIVGNGPHNYDTTLATTGFQGQSESLCFAAATAAIAQDQWFTWVATASGSIELTQCGLSSFDTKMAVYAGGGCPAQGSALACNDDSCGLVSDLCFHATLGNTYTIQIGGYSGGGIGAFQFVPSTGPVGGCAPVDDGTSENSVGLTNGGAIGWLTGYGAIGQSTTVNTISTCYGTPLFPNALTPGPVTVAIWDDPNDDGDPSDGVLLSSVTVPMAAGSINTDVFQQFTLPAPVSVSGVYFIGAVFTAPAGQYPAALDQSAGSGSICSMSPQWFFGATSGTANLTTLTANNIPPAAIAGQGLPGNWLLRVGCVVNPGVPFCFGDGSGTACPCGNNSIPGTESGCLSSLGVGGHLTATGNASISSDSLSLNGTGMPNSSALYFQGTTQLSGGAGTAFGDGLRCAGGTITRLGTKTNAGGASSYPNGSQPISIRGNNVAGNVRTYQCWYRNAAAFCTPSTFNLTNGLQIPWSP